MERFGFPTRAEAVARYAERDRASTSATVAWYEAFACWRTCVILQQLHQRYVRGESTDERMATPGDHIAMLAAAGRPHPGRALSARRTSETRPPCRST